MSQQKLPARPNLEHLKKQARMLLRESHASDTAAMARFAAFGIKPAQAKLADALHVIAREYGFETWPALKLHIDTTSEDPVAALAAAIKARRASLVAELLTRHPSLKTRLNEPLPGLDFDMPALLAAAYQDNREMSEALLKAGADVNQRSRWWAGGFGVLDFAGPELATYFVERGATVDIHSAARLGRIDRVRELLAADPQLVHARGGDGQMPLHFAATVEIAALLLDSGADVNARDIDHESTAAQYMVSTRPYRHEVAAYLVTRGARIDIFAAAAIGDRAAVERCLDDDPDVIRLQVGEKYFPKENPRAGGVIYIFGFGWGVTPHLVAHQFGHTAIFELLMQRSSPWLRLAQACEIHDEARAQAIAAKHPRLIETLSVNAARRIIGATARNNTRGVELLLAYGWPAAVVNDHNQTPLHYAAWHGNLALVTAFLERKVPIQVSETQHGGSPIGWALHGSLHSWQHDKGDYPGVVRALIAAGAEMPRPGRPLEAAEDVLEVIQQHAP